MKKEKSLLQMGDVWKATIRVPDIASSDTKLFDSERKARSWLGLEEGDFHID